MNRRHAIAILGSGVLIVGLGGLAVFLSEENPKSKEIRASLSGAAIHAESFLDDQGMQQSLGKWSGRPILLNFWATWCAPCLDEMPLLNAWSRKSVNGIQIVGIAADSRSNVEKFKKKFGITFPLLVDEAKAIEFSRRLGNRTGLLPFSVLLGPNGDVLATFLGAVDNDKVSQIEAIASKNR